MANHNNDNNANNNNNNNNNANNNNNNNNNNNDPDRRYRDYTNVGMSFWRFLFLAHGKRIIGTVQDAEDMPVLETDVRLPTAPKKGKERGLCTSMPGAAENDRHYHYLPGIDARYNAERLLLQEQQLAKLIRKENRELKRLHPVARKKIAFKINAGSGGASTSKEACSDLDAPSTSGMSAHGSGSASASSASKKSGSASASDDSGPSSCSCCDTDSDSSCDEYDSDSDDSDIGVEGFENDYVAHNIGWE